MNTRKSEYVPISTIKTENTLVDENQALIVKLTLNHWNSFPQYIKNYYSAEDLYTDLCFHIYTNSHKYDSSKGAASTFLYRVIYNYVVSVLRLKRNRVMYVDMEEVSPEISSFVRTRTQESAELLENAIAEASEDLRVAFQEFLKTRFKDEFNFQKKHIREFIRLFKKHNVSSLDFKLVLENVL